MSCDVAALSFQGHAYKGTWSIEFAQCILLNSDCECQVLLELMSIMVADKIYILLEYNIQSNRQMSPL